MPAEVRATYRVQLHAGFTFDDVAAIAPYLKTLGISHIYFSPFLQTRPGSTHGYDVVNHKQLNVELGGPAAYERMSAALEANDLGQILDIVPNHTAIGGRFNYLWWDVLKTGRDSDYASYFDIDWQAPPEDLTGKILAPVLGDDLDKVLAAGDIVLNFDGPEPCIKYYEHEFPVAPGTLTDDPSRTDVSSLLERQHYLLAHWRRAATDLNYRRFFDINELAGLEMDAPGVFEATHSLVLELVSQGKLQGLRVDHIDGLRDPYGYLGALRLGAPGCYIVVEKILEPGEELPENWPVQGTTGYDFMYVANSVLVDPSAERELTEIYRDFSGESTDLSELTREKKLLIMRREMAADLSRLVRASLRVFRREGWPTGPDVETQLRRALEETIAALHVYRTYLSPMGEASDTDRDILRAALQAARKLATETEPTTFDRLERVLLDAPSVGGGTEFVLRWQQTTGAIMAKGVEDTLFYDFNRFVALNEVGGDPGRFGMSPDAFHENALQANQRRPSSMLATSTHDTNRSEDVRGRLAVLSEMPGAWRDAVFAWSEKAARYRSGEWPDRNTEYLLWQTLLGAWPLDEQRAVQYMLKAAKEAKRHTSWLDPNVSYEEALDGFVRGVVSDEDIARDLADFAEPLVIPGRINSLAQTLIKLTYPGVPDTYRGTERWDLSLVDPDNRRPVDYDALRELLKIATTVSAGEAWEHSEDGLPKMYLISKTLDLRRRRPHAFGPESPYERLGTEDDRYGHLIGYLRANEIAVIVPRLPYTVASGRAWDGTSVILPEGRWLDELSDRDVPGGPIGAAELFSSFPVALLVRS